MGIFSNRRIRKASQNRSKIDLSSRVVTTNDFGFILPVYARETVPGDKFHFHSLKSFARLAPLQVPTFSGIKMTNRAFYVRFSSVWQPWNDFFAGRKFVTQSGSFVQFDKVPVITNKAIADYICTPSNQLTRLCEAGETYDIEYGKSDGSVKTYILLAAGRRMVNLLRSLGYHINFHENDITEFSILPLLCYLRVIYDYVIPSKYTNDINLRKLFETTSYFSSNISLLLLCLKDFNQCYFDNDYFTASWVNPNSPSPSQAPYQIIGDPFNETQSDVNNVVSYNSETGPIYFESSGQPTVLTQFGVDALKKMYDWGMRKGLAGNRYFEDIFAQFGIKLPDVQTNRCSYIGSASSYVSISDVMSTAQTEVDGNVTSVGDYAGKGICSVDGGNFSVDCNDFGMVIVVSTIVPETGYVQGRNREILHTERLDFFNPEFDKLGMQPIRNDELFADYFKGSSYMQGQNYGGKPSGIFGWTPRYSEYKKGNDLVAGDFVINSLNTGFDQYHSFRLFDYPEGTSPLENRQSFRVCDPSLNGNGFNRIFNETSDREDHFICVFNIGVSAERKMASIKDSFDLDGGETVTVDPDCQLH